METLPGTVPGEFGNRFLHLYYESLLPDPRFFCDGFFWESKLVGFLAYTSHSTEVLAAALRRRLGSYAVVLTQSLLARPQRLALLLRLAPLGLAKDPRPGKNVSAELLSYGVLPEFRRSSEFYKQHGTAVAQQLLHRAFDVLGRSGAPRVKIFIQLAEVNPFINGFYRKEGFEFVAKVKRFGVACNFYTRPLGD